MKTTHNLGVSITYEIKYMRVRTHMYRYSQIHWKPWKEFL